MVVFKCVSLTGSNPGLYAGDLSVGDVLAQYSLVAFLQQVPDLQCAILFPNEEHGGAA